MFERISEKTNDLFAELWDITHDYRLGVNGLGQVILINLRIDEEDIAGNKNIQNKIKELLNEYYKHCEED